MKYKVKAFILMLAMFLAAATAIGLRPTHKISDEGPRIDLEKMIPQKFGDWSEDLQANSLMVDPQQTALVKKLYSQTLSRTYINSAGYRIMLSLAYGKDQSDGLQMHKPEVCYPAQGFQVQKKWDETLNVAQGKIHVRRIETTFGNNRNEPITYWSLVGNTIALGEVSKKIVQIKYAFKGQIPDGLLFRVSSIDSDSKVAFEVQNEFVNSLLTTVSPGVRNNLSGL